MLDIEKLKENAGVKAANLIENEMLVGLNTKSTATYMIEHLAKRIQSENLKIKAVSTSWSTSLLCHQLQIPLLEINATSSLDIVIDGADEIDPQKNLIKGRGAAHMLEKVVASMAKHYVIIADDAKKVNVLGENFAVPIEVLPSALSIVERKLTELRAKVKIRMGAPGKDGPIISDSGNLIVDAKFDSILDPQELNLQLNSIAGVLEHGLFVGMVDQVILASPNGLIEF